MEYKIVKELTQFSLEQSINKLLREGWRPTGGIFIHENYFYQALTYKL